MTVDSKLPSATSADDLPRGDKPDELARAERTVWRLANVEFAWDITKALEFALLNTYAVPSISGLLARTGEFTDRTLKRYDDTALLIGEALRNGLDSDRATRAFARINDMHGRFRIANEDYLYVLSTFVFSPIDWLPRFARRAMTDEEARDWFLFWREFGRRMGIQDLPADAASFRDFARAFERERFVFAPSNKTIALATIDLLLTMYYAPRFLHPFGRQVALAICEPPLVKALGFDPPVAFARALALRGLAARRWLLRRLPVPTKPVALKGGEVSYPEGYNIEELGTFRR